MCTNKRSQYWTSLGSFCVTFILIIAFTHCILESFFIFILEVVSFSAFHHFDGGLNSMTFHLEHNVANFILIPHNLCSFCKKALFALLYVYVSIYIRITRREFALFSHISVKVKTASCTIPGFLSQLYKLVGIFHV